MAKRSREARAQISGVGAGCGGYRYWPRRRVYVAVPPDRDEESTRRFSSFTGDLHALADWLGRCRIRSVAMESTGVYWIPLFQILEERLWVQS